MDPIVAPAYYNLTQSPLCRLPDEVLLDIMEYLDLPSLMCLRQTSRIFLILFSSPSFRKYHPPWAEDDLSSWTPPCILSSAECERFRSLIDKDKFCPDCLNARIQGDRNSKLKTLMTRMLYCNTCEMKRSALFFSASQRFTNFTGRKKRVCLAHEGYMRICQHAVLRWADIRGWIDEQARSEQKCFRVTLCSDPSHCFTCDSGGLDEYNGIHAILEKDFGTTTFTITWNAHVSLEPFRMPTFEEEGFSTTQMRQIIETLYVDAGQYIIPEPNAYLPIRMSAFDPNVCACLRYRGRERFNWKLLPTTDIGWRSCRVEPRLNLFTPGPKGVPSGAARPPHSVSSGSSLSPMRRFGFSVERCQKCVECPALHISHEQSIGFRISEYASAHKVPVEWYGLLDPDSYGLNMDDASCHVLWCPDGNCESYSHRSNHRRFSTLFDRYIDFLEGDVS